MYSEALLSCFTLFGSGLTVEADASDRTVHPVNDIGT